MEYLKLTLKTNRRRLRLENLLLLAVRTLAIVLLFVAVARPVVSNTGFGSLLGSRGRTTRIIVIDDSLSMGYTSAGSSAMERGKQAAVNLIQQIGARDSLTVLTTSQPEMPLVRRAQLEDSKELTESIQSIPVSHVANRWKATFEVIDKHLEASPFPLREITLITDLRAHGWETDVADIVDRWAAEDVAMRVVDVSNEPTENLVLVDLRSLNPLALVDTSLTFVAKIRNDGSQRAVPQPATLTVQGKPREIQLPEIPAGESVEITLSLTFETPGQHVIDLSLPSDQLTEDDRRYLVVDVRRTLDLLLVDGEPDSQPFQSETDFLALSYSVGAAPWQVSRVTDSEWMDNPLSAPDVMVLANVATVSAQRAKELFAMVEAGMGLLIFLGDQVDPVSYNDVLFRDGEGLLPAQIARFLDQDVSGMIVEPLADSPLSALASLSSDTLSRIRPRRLASVSLAEEPGNQVRVLARWNDAMQSPAVIEKRVGQGRILLWTITADRLWRDWPTEPSYVLSMRQAAMSVASHTSQNDNVIAAQPLRLTMDLHNPPTEAILLQPNEDTPIPLPIDTSDPAAPELVYRETRYAGIYEMQWKDPVLDEISRKFSASPDVRESNLAPLEPNRFEQLMGKINYRVVTFDGEHVDVIGQGNELWQAAVIVMFVLVVFESSLAAWVGREH